jgi:hypothetical protein
MPSDFDNISPQGTGMYQIGDDGQDTERRLPITSFGSTATGWYMNKSAFTLTPVPSDAKQYKLRYIPLLVELSAETDQLVIPRRYSYHIMDVLDACYDLWDEDQQAEVFNDERVVRTMNELVSHIKPDGQVATMPDFTADYYY